MRPQGKGGAHRAEPTSSPPGYLAPNVFSICRPDCSRPPFAPGTTARDSPPSALHLSIPGAPGRLAKKRAIAAHLARSPTILRPSSRKAATSSGVVRPVRLPSFLARHLYWFCHLETGHSSIRPHCSYVQGDQHRILFLPQYLLAPPRFGYVVHAKERKFAEGCPVLATCLRRHFHINCSSRKYCL